MKDLSLKASEVHVNNGKQLAEKGDLDGALRELNQAVELDPRNTEAYNLLAEIYFNTENYEKAIASAQSCLYYDPGNIEAWLLLGNIYDEQQEYDKAIENLRYAMQYDMQNADVYYLMGYIYAEKEDFQKAKEFMGRALELNPDHESARRDLDTLNEIE
jgi:tetratricopeptide (TPR) repeat protein